MHTIEPVELEVLLNFFSTEGNGAVALTEFQHLILPCEDNVLRNMVLDRVAKPLKKDELLPIDIEHGLIAIIEREVSLQRTLEGLKRVLNSYYTFTSLSSFNTIDQHSGVINTANLDAFLRAHGHVSSDLQLLAIIRRMDADGDATVTFTEWSDFIRIIAELDHKSAVTDANV